MIDVTSNIILTMGFESHQSCLQILIFSGRGGGPLVLRPSVSKIFAYIFHQGHLLFQYSPLLQSLLTTLVDVDDDIW
jgi:hypothetical protein